MSDATVAVELGRRSAMVADASGVSVLDRLQGDDEVALAAALKNSTAGRVRPANLVLTHPAYRAPARATRLRRSAHGLAGLVRVVSSPLAAGMAIGRGGTRLAVLDVGSARADATVLGGPGEPAVLACRSERVGGDDLDEAVLEVVHRRLATSCRPRWRELCAGIDGGQAPQRRAVRAEVRRGREALSDAEQVRLEFADPEAIITLSRAELDPVLSRELDRMLDLLTIAIAEAVGYGAEWPPVLIVGGVARTPLLAELVQQRSGTVPTVPADPATAAVRGAVAAFPPTAEPVSLLALPPLRVPARPALPGIRATMATVAAAVLLTAAVLFVGLRWGPDRPQQAPVQLLAQFDYVIDVPDGWRHTGGLPERRRTVLTPAGRPGGSDLISIEQTPLDYDPVVEPRRAAAELRARYDEAVAAGSLFDSFEPAAGVAGRAVTAYRQRQPERDAVVQWYVIFDRGTQISVGCRRTEVGAAAVQAACERVVTSVRLRQPR